MDQKKRGEADFVFSVDEGDAVTRGQGGTSGMGEGAAARAQGK